jgi:predicted small secreted protein
VRVLDAPSMVSTGSFEMRSFLSARQLVLALVLLAVTGLVQACNTVEGAGTDIKKAGQGIENSAERNK